MSSYHGAEVCALIDIYIIKLAKIINKKYELSVLRYCNGRTDIIRKK